MGNIASEIRFILGLIIALIVSIGMRNEKHTGYYDNNGDWVDTQDDKP